MESESCFTFILMGFHWAGFGNRWFRTRTVLVDIPITVPSDVFVKVPGPLSTKAWPADKLRISCEHGVQFILVLDNAETELCRWGELSNEHLAWIWWWKAEVLIFGQVRYLSEVVFQEWFPRTNRIKSIFRTRLRYQLGNVNRLHGGCKYYLGKLRDWRYVTVFILHLYQTETPIRPESGMVGQHEW